MEVFAGLRAPPEAPNLPRGSTMGTLFCPGEGVLEHTPQKHQGCWGTQRKVPLLGPMS